MCTYQSTQRHLPDDRFLDSRLLLDHLLNKESKLHSVHTVLRSTLFAFTVTSCVIAAFILEKYLLKILFK
jgi:hypothetical protein